MSGAKEQDAFDKLKSCLAKIPNLQYFNPKHKTHLIADASPVALGAVLLQFLGDDEPKIISFASRSLTDVEKRYSQTEKESLSLFIYLFIYILALQVHTYNYRASHIELIFYINIIFKLLKQFLSLLINIID